MAYEITPKPPAATSANYLFEFVRTKDGYMLDTVGVIDIKHTAVGIEIRYDYERYGIPVKGLTGTVGQQDFAEARARSKTKEDFAKTRVVDYLFADGSRFWTNANRTAAVDPLADMDFIESLKQPQ